MKAKKDGAWLCCVSCKPFRRFYGPHAAALLEAHYRDAKHDEKAKK